MSYQLPPNLLRLFQPRPPLTFQPPNKQDRDPRRTPIKTKRPLLGVSEILERVRQEAADKGQATNDVDNEEGANVDEFGKELTHTEQTKREIRREEKKKQKEQSKAQRLEKYDPKGDPEATGDPFCTLFISRLEYSVTENDLEREFGMYGPIQRIRLVRDRQGKSRGYAFVVFEQERDMRAAYKDTEGIKIKGRRAMVDVERGRTVRDWKPTRLGGGLGGLTRKKKEPPAPAPEPAFGMRGGRGGFRGGRGGFGGRGGRGGGFGGGPRSFGGGGGGFNGPPRGDGYGRFDGPPPKRGRY